MTSETKTAYHLFKKDSYWRIPLILILILYLIATTSATTIDDTAYYLHSNSPNDRLFVGYVYSHVATEYRYEASTKWTVNSTPITQKNHVGDCSEFALLYQQMISPYLKSYIVWGTYQGTTLHDTVKVFLHDQQEWVYVDMYHLNIADAPFVEGGYGLHPGETVIY